MAYSPKFERKLTRQGKHSFYVIIPPEFVRYLKWKEKQDVVVQIQGSKIVIQKGK